MTGMRAGRRIVLHAGFHKTGTTSLQAALAAHRGALCGFAHVETHALSPDLSLAADAARQFSRDGRAGALQAAMAAWVAGLPDLEGQGLIVSCEDFAGHMPGRFGLTDYRAVVQTVPAAVEALRARFAGAEVTVLFTTRAAEGWLKSLHWQVAWHPDLTLKQRQFCRHFAKAAEFGAVLGRLEQALAGRAEIRTAALESLSLRRLGPVEAVYDLAGLPDALRAGLAAPGVQNRGGDASLADQFVRLNRAGLPAAELRRAKSAMLGLMQSLDEAEEGGSPFSRPVGAAKNP